MEFAAGLAIGLVCALPVAVMLWIEVRAYRQLVTAAADMVAAIEEQQAQMLAGFVGAINERLAAEQAPEGRAH